MTGIPASIRVALPAERGRGKLPEQDGITMGLPCETVGACSSPLRPATRIRHFCAEDNLTGASAGVLAGVTASRGRRFREQVAKAKP